MIHQKDNPFLEISRFLTPPALVPGKGGVVSLRALESRMVETAWFQGLSSRHEFGRSNSCLPIRRLVDVDL